MKQLFTWQQLCRSVATVCMVALIVVHTFVQQQTSSTPGMLKQPDVPALFKPGKTLSPQLETGMIFPRWGTRAYDSGDTNWLAGLHEIKSQTGARWVALTINFYQATVSSTQVTITSNTPTPASLAEGIDLARSMGYRVFIIPMISLNPPQAWSGYIHFQSQSQAQVWFDNYWRILQPYVITSQEKGADQFSIGSELTELEAAPADLWQQLVNRVNHIFTRTIVYCMNWTSLYHSIPSWMQDTQLYAIGISTYIPLTTRAQRLDAKQLPMLWHTKIDLTIDAFAARLGKPILLSELGYRDTALAGYNPWQTQTHETRDDAEQAALFEAALQNIAADRYITGMFVWAWSFPPFAPNGKPAAQVIHQWYSGLNSQ